MALTAHIVDKMTELICPNCGTSNSPDKGFCQSCHANLAFRNTKEGFTDNAIPESEDNQSPTGGDYPGFEDESIETPEDNNNLDDLFKEETEKAEIDINAFADSESGEEDGISDDSQYRDPLPDWLVDLTSEEVGKDEERVLKDPEIDEDEQGLNNLEKEFSAWLSEIEKDDDGDIGEEEAKEPVEEIADEPELEQVELPEWLEAMRPVELVAPPFRSRDEANELLEGRGPLAGIWGVLPSEPDSAREGEPKSTSVALQVSDNHRVNADLLKGMLGEKWESKPLASSRVFASQDYIRWIIALILFAAIIWALITSSQEQNPRSLSTPNEVVSVYNLINGLTVGDRVLVAFEYDPGLSPELDAAAAPVVDHLLLRGVYLTMVSTSPIGPLLGERFLTFTQVDHTLRTNRNYVNLGYIPASTAGLISFSQNPRRTLPFTIESEPAWGDANQKALLPLQGIYQVSDFTLVVVIVDQPEVARAWIEQVLPHLQAGLERTPLVMVSSAQAEPLIRPYYEAIPKQIQGLVTGLAGGTSYTSLTRRDSLPLIYWEAFGTGLIIAALLITIGGIVNISISLFPRQINDEGEGLE